MIDDEVRLEAGGMPGGGWTFTWSAHNTQGERTGTVTHAEDDAPRKVAFFRPSAHGIDLVECVAKRARPKGEERAQFSFAVQQGPRDRRDPVRSGSSAGRPARSR